MQKGNLYSSTSTGRASRPRGQGGPDLATNTARHDRSHAVHCSPRPPHAPPPRHSSPRPPHSSRGSTTFGVNPSSPPRTNQRAARDPAAHPWATVVSVAVTLQRFLEPAAADPSRFEPNGHPLGKFWRG